jgi:hypothetical protein
MGEKVDPSPTFPVRFLVSMLGTFRQQILAGFPFPGGAYGLQSPARTRTGDRGVLDDRHGRLLGVHYNLVVMRQFGPKLSELGGLWILQRDN